MNYLRRILNLFCLAGFEHAKDHWKSQRETAVILVILSGWFIYQLLFNLDLMNYEQIKYWFAQPLNALIISLLSLYLIYHAELGLQVILEDYISEKSLRKSILYIIRGLRIIVILMTLFSVFTITIGST